MLNRIQFFALWIFLSGTAFAHPNTGIGSLAHQAMEPISIAYNIIGTASFVIGILFYLTSIIRYFEYRQNPLRTQLSTVIFLVIMGTLLVFLPFLAAWIDSGISFFMMDWFISGN